MTSDVLDTTLVSINMAAALLGVSKRTLWRRIADGALTAHAGGAGERTLVDVLELRPVACIPLGDEEVPLVVAADNNRAAAQCELGLMFMAAGRLDEALLWLRQAADKYYGEAMYWVARCELAGEGMAQDVAAARQGFARAADYGHVLARVALDALGGHEAAGGDDPQGAVDAVDAAERAAVRAVLEATRNGG